MIVTTALTRAGITVALTHSMSPEQVRDEPVDARISLPPAFTFMASRFLVVATEFSCGSKLAKHYGVHYIQVFNINEHINIMNKTAIQFEVAFEIICRMTNRSICITQADLSPLGPHNGKLTIRRDGRTEDRPCELRNNLSKTNVAYWSEEWTRQQPDSFILLSNYIQPSVRSLLREKRIQYIDESANCYFQFDKSIVLIEGQKRTAGQTEDSKSKVFKKAGLRLIVNILAEDDVFETTYRRLAASASIAVGTAHYVMDGLVGMGYVKQISRNRYRFANRRDLAIRWAEEYDIIMRASLVRGKYRFFDRVTAERWREIDFSSRAYWSGMSGASLLSSIVKPVGYVLYARVSNVDLAKLYHIVRDDSGDIEVLECFWNSAHDTNGFQTDRFYNPAPGKSVAPFVVMYADLARLGDSRLNEVAHGYLEEYLSTYD